MNAFTTSFCNRRRQFDSCDLALQINGVATTNDKLNPVAHGNCAKPTGRNLGDDLEDVKCATCAAAYRLVILAALVLLTAISSSFNWAMSEINALTNPLIKLLFGNIAPWEANMPRAAVATVDVAGTTDVSVGDRAQIDWSTGNATACAAASGSWSGSRAIHALKSSVRSMRPALAL